MADVEFAKVSLKEGGYLVFRYRIWFIFPWKRKQKFGFVNRISWSTSGGGKDIYVYENESVLSKHIGPMRRIKLEIII